MPRQFRLGIINNSSGSQSASDTVDSSLRRIGFKINVFWNGHCRQNANQHNHDNQLNERKSALDTTLELNH